MGTAGTGTVDTWGQEPSASKTGVVRLGGTAGSDSGAQRGQEPSASKTGHLPNPRAAKNENENPEGLSFSLVAGTGTLLVCGYTRKPVVPNPGSLT